MKLLRARNKYIAVILQTKTELMVSLATGFSTFKSRPHETTKTNKVRIWNEDFTQEFTKEDSILRNTMATRPKPFSRLQFRREHNSKYFVGLPSWRHEDFFKNFQFLSSKIF